MKFFADVLEEYIQRQGISTGRLASLSNVPKPTIQSWREGRVKRPRHLDPILQVARVLRLTVAQTNELLSASKHPSVDMIRQMGESENNKALLSLLAFWEEQQEQLEDEKVLLPSFGWNSASRRPFQVPPQISDFVGRADEVTMISADLKKEGAICVLQGMGGVGKSTVANHLAYRLSHHFDDGVLWGTVSHGRADDSNPHQQTMMILRDFAGAYGVDVSEYADIEQRSRIVLHLLASKRTLIILDDALSTEDIRHLLPASTARCSILITTRNKKMLSNRASIHSLTSFAGADSLALLRHITGSERIDAEIEEATKLIAFVGGLPLALRVIGSTIAEAGWLTLQEYRHLLQDEQLRLEQLADWDDASRNVRASFELSYSRLKPNDQSLFNQLSLFSSHDFSAEAVAAMMQQAIPFIKINLGRLRALSLLNFSIVDTPDMVNQQARYHLHPLLRAFAREKLGQPDLTQKERFVTYYAQFVREYGFDQYQILDQEWENIQTAITWASENGWDETLYHLIDGITQPNLGTTGYLDTRNYRSEGIVWLQRCLDTSYVQQNNLFTALCHMKRGRYAYDLAQIPLATEELQKSHTLVNNPADEQEAICYAYTCHRLAGVNTDIEEILTWFQNAIDCLERFDSPRLTQLRGSLLIYQAAIWGKIGELDQADEIVHEGLNLLPDHPTYARAGAYINLFSGAYSKGDLLEAKRYHELGFETAQRLGDFRLTAIFLGNIGWVKLQQGDFVHSIKFFEQAIEQYNITMTFTGKVSCMSNLATSLYLLGQEEACFEMLDLNIGEKGKGIVEDEMTARLRRAELRLDLEEISKAVEDLDEIEKLSSWVSNPQGVGIWLVRKAQVALINQQFEEAKRFIEQSLNSNMYGIERSIANAIRGDVLTALHQYEDAMVAYDESLQVLQKGWHLEYTRTLTKVARLKWVWRQDNTVIKDLEEILAAFNKMGAVREIARVQKLIDEINLAL